MKKLFYILLLLISVKTYGQQPAPFNPVQLNQNTMYYEPITGDRYGYNGAVYKWYRIPFVIAPNTVINGLALSVSGNTLTVQPGYWRISNIIYHKTTTTIFTLAARDSVYSRYETVYADSANNIGIAVGTLSPNPVEPSIPSGDLRVGAALITPTGTSTIQPGPITNYVFTNPLVKQFAFPWVYSLRADTIKTAHYIFPVNDGTSGQVIQTDGAGNLFWSNQAIYNAGFGLNLTANVFSADTIRMVTQTALRDTLTAHTAHIGFGLLTSNDTLKVDTLVLPFIPLNFRSNIKVRQHGDTLSFNGPVIGTPLEGVYQSNPGARESSDFAVFGSGVNTSTNPKLLTSIHGTVAYRAFMRGSTAANPLSGTDASGLIIGDQDITAAAGGSYAMFNQLAIKPLHIINTGGATIDSAYTLNITGAPTGAGVNGGLKVKGGVTLLDLPPITGGTSLVVDAGGNVGTGSGGGSLIDGSGTTAVGGNQVNLGGTLTSNFNLNLNGNQVDFHNYNSFTSYDFLTADNPSPTIDSANYSHFAINNTGVDITVNKDISHRLFVYLDVATRVGFNSAFGISDDITHNGIEISHINHAAYTNNSLVNKSYADSTAKFKADSVKGTITSGVSSVSGVAANGFTWSIANPTTTPAITLTQQNATTSQSGQLTSTDWNTFNGKQAALGFTPENIANKSTTTTLGTSNTLYPTQNAVKVYVDNAVSGVTVPTGANPTASIGFTAVNGSSSNFTRADGAPKADSTVIASAANHPTLAQVQTGLNTKQATLVSGTNIKMVNSNSLLGSGNVAVGDALVANPLSQFASTTSAQLLGVLSDETGSGAAVFGTTPTLATPVINGLPTGTGVASGATASTLVSRDVNANVTNNNIILNGQSIATAAGTTTLTVASPNKTIFTGSTTQTVTLPVASTLSLYQVFQIKNSSSGVVTVNSSGGNLVQSIAAGATSTFTCILTSGTTAASWWVDYGIGSTGILPIANGGTGSATQNFVDLTTNQTIAGIKTLSLTNTASSGSNNGTVISHTTNQTGTAKFTDLLINRIPTAQGSGTQNFLDLQYNSVSRASFNTGGDLILTTGAINQNNGNTNTFTGPVTVTALTTMNSGFVAGSSNTNVYVATQSNSFPLTASQYLFGGAANIHFRTGLGGNGSTQIALSASYANTIIVNSPISTWTTGTHNYLANLVVKPIGTITNNGATVNNTVTAFFQGATTGGTNNYDIYAIGLNRMDSLQTVNLKLNGSFGAANQIPMINSGGTALTWVTAYTGLITGTPTIVAGTGAGTSPTVSVTTNGKQLQVTVTTGTLPTGTNATIATVTLPNALTYTPLPVFSSASAATALLNGASMIYMTSTGTANVTITSGTTALTAATTYVWNIAL